MAIRIVRLGSARTADEGIRVGTVRRPPRGVPKTEFSTGDWYDVWFPVLAPSAEAMKLGLSAESPRDWARFEKKYRSEMARPDAAHALNLVAALSHTSNLSVGCYCEDDARCHRSLLRALLAARGAWLI